MTNRYKREITVLYVGHCHMQGMGITPANACAVLDKRDFRTMAGPAVSAAIFKRERGKRIGRVRWCRLRRTAIALHRWQWLQWIGRRKRCRLLPFRNHRLILTQES